MENEWKIAKSNQTCQLCAARFGEGQVYYSALFEQGQGFERRDYCPKCFKEHRPEGVYSFWKTAVAEEDRAALGARVVLDPESLLDFFRRLGAEETPQRISFRYVLALMLARKRILRFAGSDRDAGGREVMLFVERQGGERHRIPVVAMDEGVLAAVSAELGQLLGLAPPSVPPAAPEGSGIAAEPAPGTAASGNGAPSP